VAEAKALVEAPTPEALLAQAEADADLLRAQETERQAAADAAYEAMLVYYESEARPRADAATAMYVESIESAALARQRLKELQRKAGLRKPLPESVSVSVGRHGQDDLRDLRARARIASGTDY